MATLIIQFQDSKFVAHNGVNVEKFTENEVLANGWKCTITENHRIDCIATEYYKKERHQIKLKIKNGWVKVLLKIGDDRPRVLQSYKLDKWPENGTIVLPEGYIDKRKPRFRKLDFQDFLDQYNLTAVRYEEANGIYTTVQEHNGHAVVFNEVIETDGNIKVIHKETNVDENSLLKPFTIEEMIEVSDSTWVLKTVSKMGKYLHRILYTTEDLQKIKGLPKWQ
jgi:hypothetical protein